MTARTTSRATVSGTSRNSIRMRGSSWPPSRAYSTMWRNSFTRSHTGSKMMLVPIMESSCHPDLTVLRSGETDLEVTQKLETIPSDHVQVRDALRVGVLMFRIGSRLAHHLT